MECANLIMISLLQRRYALVVTGVTHGAMMVYMSFLPMHAKRKPKALRELIKVDEGATYVDLTIAFQDKKGVAVTGPAVRFWF